MIEKYLFWHRITLLSYFALFVIIGIWYLVISQPEHTITWIFLISYLVILLIPAPGLLQKRARVYMWSSYLMLIYISHAIIESWANENERILALLELVFSLSYFVAATMCTRYVKHIMKDSNSNEAS